LSRNAAAGDLLLPVRRQSASGGVYRAVHGHRQHGSVDQDILETGFDPAGEIQFALDDQMMVLKMPEYNKAFYLAQQDKIVPGISIANSEVGILSLSIEAFYYRLICTNGLISKTAVDARYKHISRKAMDEFPDIMRGVISQSQRGHDRFRISAETHVDNPESTIDSFARQFQITQKEAQIVKEALLLEQGRHHVSRHQCLYQGCPGQKPVCIRCLSAGTGRRADIELGEVIACIPV
jgi:hypothetical protein